MHCPATSSKEIRRQTLWKALHNGANALRWLIICSCLELLSMERQRKWASYQNKYWQWVSSRYLDKNKWKVLLECACLPFCLLVILWCRSSWVRNFIFECGVCHGFSSCSLPSCMNFMNFKLSYAFYEEITFFFKQLFLNVSYSWNSQSIPQLSVVVLWKSVLSLFHLSSFLPFQWSSYKSRAVSVPCRLFLYLCIGK